MRSNITPTEKQIPSYYYPNNVGKAKEISAPILFKGGVATNVGIKAAFEKALEKETIVPGHCHFMGALSVAMLAGFLVNGETKSFFRGFTLSQLDFKSGTFTCSGWPNICEIVNLFLNGRLLARRGSRCGKLNDLNS